MSTATSSLSSSSSTVSSSSSSNGQSSNGTTPTTYQKELWAGQPSKIEELGISPEELAKRKSYRKLLFAIIIVIFVAAISLLGSYINQHELRKEIVHDDGDNNNNNNNNKSVRGGLDDLSFDIPPLDGLDRSTNASSVPNGCESTLLILAHCEKDGPEATAEDGSSHCSYLGHERAAYIPTLFGHHRWPRPSFLFATSEQRRSHMNFREIETLSPLAKKYNLTILSNHSTIDEFVHNFYNLLATGELCGKVAVLSWRKEQVPAIARGMSCSHCPKDFGNTYDDVWQLRFVFNVEKTSIYKMKKMSNRQYDNKQSATQFENIESEVDEDEQSDLSERPQQQEEEQKEMEQQEQEDEGQERQEEDGERKRYLKKRHDDQSSENNHPHWTVYFAVSAQAFDPLKFSYQSGDYQGNPVGGKWMTMDEGEL